VTFSTLDLTAPPSVLKETLRAFVTKKAAGAAHGAPGLEGWLRGVTFDADRVSAYADLCGFTPSDRVPLSYPQVLALPVQLALGNDPRFPFRLPGMVHVGNSFRQTAPLHVGDVVDLRAWTQGSRQTKLGTEADLHTACYREGVLIWQSTAAIVFERAKKPDGPKESRTDAADPVPWTPCGDPWQVPAAQGRLYAAVSGDYNPIHLYGWSARLFGFKRPIVHGMWTLARSIAALEASHPAAPVTTLSVQFRSPLYLPSSARFEQRAAEEGGTAFRLVDLRSGKLILQGSAAR
jgi:acyl dehydratase